MTPELRRERLRVAGEVLYGPRSASRLATGLERSPQLIAKILAGEREVTDELEQRLFQLLERESKALALRSQQAMSIAFSVLKREFRVEDYQGDDGWSPAPPVGPLTDEDRARLEEDLSRPDDEQET